ncbi:MAG: hypothetical protein IAF38_20255 [Bacteroidia bacterium]|nr:hypothetical protein [Bacteroidia bacterium]
MKKYSAFLLLLLVVFSCKKYPEGPTLSLSSKKERMANSWVLIKAIESGVDKTGDYQTAFKDFNLVIDKEGTYSMSYVAFGIANYSETGSWFFNGNKEKVTFDPSSNGNDNSTDNILRLKQKELWLLDEDFNGKILEMHLAPK